MENTVIFLMIYKNLKIIIEKYFRIAIKYNKLMNLQLIIYQYKKSNNNMKKFYNIW